MTQTLSDTLCHHIAQASAPPSAIAAARNVLLDASGVMYAASGQSPDVQAFINVAAAAGAGRRKKVSVLMRSGCAR